MGNFCPSKQILLPAGVYRADRESAIDWNNGDGWSGAPQDAITFFKVETIISLSTDNTILTDESVVQFKLERGDTDDDNDFPQEIGVEKYSYVIEGNTESFVVTGHPEGDLICKGKVNKVRGGRSYNLGLEN
jgi:hypothetical protein